MIKRINATLRHISPATTPTAQDYNRLIDTINAMAEIVNAQTALIEAIAEAGNRLGAWDKDPRKAKPQ